MECRHKQDCCWVEVTGHPHLLELLPDFNHWCLSKLSFFINVHDTLVMYSACIEHLCTKCLSMLIGEVHQCSIEDVY